MNNSLARILSGSDSEKDREIPGMYLLGAKYEVRTWYLPVGIPLVRTYSVHGIYRYIQYKTGRWRTFEFPV